MKIYKQLSRADENEKKITRVFWRAAEIGLIDIEPKKGGDLNVVPNSATFNYVRSILMKEGLLKPYTLSHY